MSQTNAARRRVSTSIAAAALALGAAGFIAGPAALAASRPMMVAAGRPATIGQIGTPQAAQTIDGRPILRTITMVATAYGPSAQDNYPYGAVDYFGQPLKFGMVAVDPSVIPLGTSMYIQGYSDSNLPSGGFVARALDEGDSIQGDRVDIFMPDNPTIVSNFGIQRVTVDILGPAGS
jgi:3D (Asp-Asp-Asp) domain-containing protein